jgi:cob(I)alamin adenosyltransferase
MKIYTKTGDDGTTSLFSGGRVKKDHLRVEVYGTIDELNSVLGVVRASKPVAPINDMLEKVQSDLFRLGSDLATPMDTKADWLVRLEEDQIIWLEETIDAMDLEIEPLKNFILPGGTMAAAQLHVARTICRRAERLLVTLQEIEDVGEVVRPYVNRLSDWLFTMARYENLYAEIDETKWQPRG